MHFQCITYIRFAQLRTLCHILSKRNIFRRPGGLCYEPSIDLFNRFVPRCICYRYRSVRRQSLPRRQRSILPGLHYSEHGTVEASAHNFETVSTTYLSVALTGDEAKVAKQSYKKISAEFNRSQTA
jgi:hypothetical protein